MNYRETISYAVVDAMRRDSKVILLGQNVTAPHGVFGTTVEAFKRFPGQVIETPVSETMLTGACVGLAMEGYQPIYVHCRADFSLFSFEHLVNTAAKLPFLHGKPLPFVMRVVIGRGWGQGPVHSQSWHHMLAQVPGLQAYMPVFPPNYAYWFFHALASGKPSVILEPRRLYETALRRPPGSPVETMMALADIVFFAYGDIAIEAFEAAHVLGQCGVTAYVVPLEDLGGIPPITSKPSLTLDIVPRKPMRGLLAPPFRPLGVSIPLEQVWYVTTNNIVSAACKMLNVKPPEAQENYGGLSPAIRSAF